MLDSELTLIEDGRAYIRGHDLVALSRERTFEEVAALLWTGDPDDAAALLPPARDDAGGDLPMLGGPVVAALAAHLTAAGERSLATLGAGDAAALRGAARVVAGLFAAAGARGRGAAGRAPGPRVGLRPRPATSRPRSSCPPTTSSTSARSPRAPSRRPTPRWSTSCSPRSARCAAGATAA